MQQSKKEIHIILLSGLLFLLLFGICSYFNRFAVDDYYHIHDEKLYGIWGGMLEGYYNWGGRWTSYLLWGCIFHFHEIRLVLILYTFSIILFFILSIYFLLCRIFEITGIQEKKKNIIAFAILFSSFTFFFSFGKGEIWFWAQSTTMFIVSIIAFVISLSLILSSKNNIFTILILILCATYAGGASETYAVSFILFLLLMFTSILYFKKSGIIRDIKKQVLIKIFIALTFLVSAFIISFVAPGNSIRAGWLPESSFIKTFYITFKELGKLYLFKFSLQLPWILLFIAPFMHLGFSQRKAKEDAPFKKIFKPVILSFIMLIFIHYILLFPSCYILSEAGPDRSLSILIILTTIYISFWSYEIGRRYYSNKTVLKTGSLVSVLSFILVIISVIIIQFNLQSKYAKALDARTSFLKNLQKQSNSKTVTVSKLPPSGYLYSAEISEDTAYFGNEHYRLGLFLDFKVKSE